MNPKRIWGCVTLVVAVLLGSGYWWSTRFERSLSRGVEAFESEEWNQALDSIRIAESNPSTRQRALLLRVRVMLAMGRPREAVPPLNEINPNGELAAEVPFWKGRTLFAAGQTLLSVPWFQLATTKRPNDPEAFRWLAAAAYEHGAVSLAVPALQTVLKLEPKDGRAWRTLAAIHKDYAKFEEACNAYREALRLGAADSKARLEFADCLTTLAAYDEAEFQIKACVGLVDEAQKSYLLASCLRGRGDIDGFEHLVEERIERFPRHAGLLMLRSTIASREGRDDEAVAWLDRAVIADPYRAESYYRRGQVLTRLGRRDEGEADRRKSEELNRAIAEIAKLDEFASQKPGDAAVRCELGRLCATLGRFPLAASWYRAALACDPAREEARRGLESLRGLGG